jgi:hypothetical protein
MSRARPSRSNVDHGTKPPCLPSIRIPAARRCAGSSRRSSLAARCSSVCRVAAACAGQGRTCSTSPDERPAPGCGWRRRKRGNARSGAGSDVEADLAGRMAGRSTIFAPSAIWSPGFCTTVTRPQFKNGQDAVLDSCRGWLGGFGSFSRALVDLALAHDVARVREKSVPSGRIRSRRVPADVISMQMRAHDDVDILRRSPAAARLAR